MEVNIVSKATSISWVSIIVLEDIHAFTC